VVWEVEKLRLSGEGGGTRRWIEYHILGKLAKDAIAAKKLWGSRCFPGRKGGRRGVRRIFHQRNRNVRGRSVIQRRRHDQKDRGEPQNWEERDVNSVPVILANACKGRAKSKTEQGDEKGKVGFEGGNEPIVRTSPGRVRDHPAAQKI